MGQNLPDWKSSAVLVKKIAQNFKLPYYTISPTYSVCPSCGYLSGEQATCPTCGLGTEVYSRITGYYRPVKNWNDGKLAEFNDRLTYDMVSAVDAPVEGKDRETMAKKSQNTVSINGDKELIMLASQTCPNCKAAKSVLENNGISYRVVYAEDTEGARLASAYDILSAPTLIETTGDEVRLHTGLSDIIQYANAASA